LELLKLVHKKEGGIEGLELVSSTTGIGTKDVETEVSTESNKEEDEDTVTNKKVMKKKNAIMVPVRALFYSHYHRNMSSLLTTRGMLLHVFIMHSYTTLYTIFTDNE